MIRLGIVTQIHYQYRSVRAIVPDPAGKRTAYFELVPELTDHQVKTTELRFLDDRPQGPCFKSVRSRDAGQAQDRRAISRMDLLPAVRLGERIGDRGPRFLARGPRSIFARTLAVRALHGQAPRGYGRAVIWFMN